MGSTSRYGRATINPAGPEALGICDRCGFLYNLRVLRWQMQWRGTSVQNLHIRVCDTCYDVPSEFLRTLILPPDPMPVMDARTEPYTIDEKNFLTLSAITGTPFMFFDQGEMNCEIESSLGIVAAVTGVSDATAALLLGVSLTAPFSDAGAMTAALLLGIGLTAPFSDAGAVTADVDVVTPVANVTREATDSFSFLTANTYTETGASIGTAVADRLVFVAISGANAAATAGVDSMTIGGIAATLASSVTRAGSIASYLSEIWYAAVPTGTTANIVLTFTGDTIGASAAVYKVLNADSVTPIASQNTGSVASGNVSAAVTIGNQTAVIATASCGVDTADVDITWTNATEDFDLAVDLGGIFANNGFASRADTSGPGSTTITASPADDDTDTNKTLAIVVIAPA